ncbi:MAG: electron transfer flavoprotein subunit alpha/FixB family protein [Gemmatimonadaceae bacterium]|nr:electron transfer flavoprotein subunit alpha/FixB family protein [Gemmatimonadaceae bacterium]
MANVLVVAELRAGDVRKVALEATTAGRRLAALSGGGQVHVLAAGPTGVAAKAEAFAQHGADQVLLLEHDGFAQYNPEALAATVAQLLQGGTYRYGLFSATAQGRDLSPRVAAKLGLGLAADVIDFAVEGETVVARHPVNTGKVIATLALTGTPSLVSVRPSAFQPAIDARPLATQAITSPVDPAASRVQVIELKQGNTGKIDLGDAPVIVAGGRGLKAPEHFALCEALADAFGNAAVGATRAVTDEGWRPHADQIGQTGRTVSPSLYIAVGISGAIQHLAGMRTSKTIVAINKDKDAPIFKIADYGIVGDVFDVVPALTAAVKAAMANG